MYLSWIIPTYNEERRISKTLREVDAYLQSKRFSGGWEILVVDSSSRDRTAEIVHGLRSRIANLSLLIVENRGKGWAVREGMLRARGEIRLFSDADNSTSPQHFDKMVPLFEQGSDVIISSRDAKDAPGAGRTVKEPWYREVLGKAGNLVIQAVGVWGIWDTQNGFKAFTAKAAADIFRHLRVAGWAFDVEVLAIAKKRRYRLGIIPVVWRYDPDSRVNWKAYLDVLASTFRIRWNLLTNQYRLPRA